MQMRWMASCCLLAAAAGCGTTRWTDTPRTATEQLLISDAMDRAVSRLDLKALAGREVFLDAAPMAGVTDSAYLVSSLRQHMLASGCVLKDKREEADYIVEARAGVVGTDKQELMLGVPSVSVPQIAASPVPASTIPEIPIVKRTQQRAVAKIALFAYNAKTGRPVWQSGIIPVESTAKDVWVVGAGPFQRGSIYRGTQLAGNPVDLPLLDSGEDAQSEGPPVAVADEAFFSEAAKGVTPASHAASSPGAAPPSTELLEADKPTEPLLGDGVAPPPGLVAPAALAEDPDRVPRVLAAPPDPAPMPPESTTRWQPAPSDAKTSARHPAADPSLVLAP